jgi:hypothetical protein
MMNRAVYTDGSRPEHLGDKYRVYALRLEDGGLVKVHIGRPVSFRTFAETFIFQHPELVNEKTKFILQVSQIVGLEKIPNSNKPDFELTATGQLLEIG